MSVTSEDPYCIMLGFPILSSWLLGSNTLVNTLTKKKTTLYS